MVNIPIARCNINGILYRSEDSEFVRLVYYLELVSEGMDWSKFNAAVALCFPKPGLQAPRTWFRELATYIERSQVITPKVVIVTAFFLSRLNK